MPRKQIGVGQIAKRVYWREADARALIEAWRSSGEPLTRFAQRYGVERSRLTRWLKRLEQAAPMVLHPVRLMEASPGAGSGAGAIEIELADGPCVRVSAGFRADDLRRVLLVLAESAAC